MNNALQDIHRFGQSIWYDNIRRGLIASGELARMIQEDGLRGLTSNPAIFEKAIAGSSDYVAELTAMGRLKELSTLQLYEHLAIHDIQGAADLLRPVYESSQRRDGYASLEVSPALAADTHGTVEEARRLWKAIDRPNVMIKVPATPEGIPAIRLLIAEGINVNVTLLFAQERYEQVADAFISGLHDFLEKGGDVGRVASVASFFISRIDTLVDGLVADKLKTAPPHARGALKGLFGKVAIANAKLTYQSYLRIYRSERWAALAQKGAMTQRLLWASTGTKNPAYRDVYYVEELIGPDTVNTVPPATFDAFRDHGQLRPSLLEGLEEAHDTLRTLGDAGISMRAVTDQLLAEALRLFNEPFNKLLAVLAKRREDAQATSVNKLTYQLPAELLAQVSGALEEWLVHNKVRRFWARDASLWTGADEASWMGWVSITEEQLANVDQLTRLAEEVKRGGFRHALLLGMGGSSLCPEVLAQTYGSAPGFPELLVLDSTDPAQLAAIESRIDPKRTLFIVSSKSGSTLEPNIFKQYFFTRTAAALGQQEAAKRFIGITDPGSKMYQVAKAERFSHIFLGVPSIGGRYSALSHFGMVPAAAIGLDLLGFLDRAEQMVQACQSVNAPKENPGALLGVLLGVLGKAGRDKVTLVTSPGIRDFGAWLEQLIAESTGKDGRGLIPVDREDLAQPERYGADRVFAYLRLESAPDAAQDQALERLAKTGHPVIRISVPQPYELAQEFFRWEMATAVAGSILGINPFNQPDVEASKLETRKLTSEYEQSGALPNETPIFDGDGVRLYADKTNADAIRSAAGGHNTLGQHLRAHLSRLSPGDYFAILAYIPMNEGHERALQAIRLRVRDSRRNATCLGFGPRFLHSTGQGYKGGPNSGVFLQITCDDLKDLSVPGQKYTFGVVKAAQARGDFEVLAERGRRALRVHLGTDVQAGLKTLANAVEGALKR